MLRKNKRREKDKGERGQKGMADEEGRDEEGGGVKMEDEKEGMSRRQDSAPSPPSPMSKLDRRHTGRLRKRDKFLTGEGGRGWGRMSRKACDNKKALSSIHNLTLSYGLSFCLGAMHSGRITPHIPPFKFLDT